jgi:hypothetical protein
VKRINGSDNILDAWHCHLGVEFAHAGYDPVVAVHVFMKHQDV